MPGVTFLMEPKEQFLKRIRVGISQRTIGETPGKIFQDIPVGFVRTAFE